MHTFFSITRSDTGHLHMVSIDHNSCGHAMRELQKRYTLLYSVSSSYQDVYRALIKMENAETQEALNKYWTSRGYQVQ